MKKQVLIYLFCKYDYGVFFSSVNSSMNRYSPICKKMLTKMVVFYTYVFNLGRNL